MTRALRLGLCACFTLSACNVASVQEQPSAIPLNHCTSDADCPFGSCISDNGGSICGSTKGSFDTLLFEVTPPADSTSIAGVQFIQSVEGVLQLEGPLDLPLKLVAQLSGAVFVAARNCTPQFDYQGSTLASASDGSIPALITLIPSSSALGLFSSPVAVQAMLPESISWTFEINVPPGQYDIYIEPRHQPDASCVVPPQLLREQAISGTVSLDITLPEPQTFEFHVTWPLGDDALAGWSVDMLDPISGRAISNRVLLALAPGAKTDYVANLSYLPVVGDTVKADQLVRLSPPDGVTAPTLVFARSGLGLFSASEGTLSQFTSLPTPVHITGQVTALSTPAPIAATVTLAATKITGIDPGVLASFVRTISVADDGTFELDVLPGTYRVAAVPDEPSDPSATTYAEVTADWVVGSSPSIQAGRVLALSSPLPINGQAYDPSQKAPMSGAQVQAVASPASIATDVLHQALGETVNVPRAASATVEDKGAFALHVDVGTYDFSVRPRASSGFAWLVSPSVGVGTSPATANGVGFNQVALPVPIVYSGTLTVPGVTPGSSTTVPGALISSYIYMKGGAYTSDATQADSVLQIAETRSDEFGAFTLLIPATLNAAPKD